MFTGIVQAIGRVVGTGPGPGGARRISIDAAGWPHRPGLGESISVSGCCLTVAAEPDSGGGLAFDVVPETLAKTTLGALKAGSRVNLERSVTPQDLLGGHIVQGHVDGTGTVEAVQSGADWRVTIRPPPGLMEFIVPKGSVALDGVSLTVARVEPGAGILEVALIPTTLSLTTLGDLRPGDRVNIEADAIAKTVVHWVRNYGAR